MHLDGGWEPPKYLQLFGDGTYANRVNLEASPYVITYQSENSVSPTGSYVSDDYFGFLEDQYGEGIGDKLAIGVGRIACETETEANAMVDKIVAYMRHPSAEVMEGGCVGEVGADDGRWRNRICFVSDDMDGNGGPTEIEHMVNSDEHATKLAQEHPEKDSPANEPRSSTRFDAAAFVTDAVNSPGTHKEHSVRGREHWRSAPQRGGTLAGGSDVDRPWSGSVPTPRLTSSHSSWAFRNK